MSRYLFFSDLHLGPDDGVDNFTGAKRFFDFIKWKDTQKIDKTFVVGDIYELWQSKLFKNEQQRFDAIENRYQSVINVLKKFTWIPGNHDWFLKSKYNLQEEVLIEDNGYKILVLHGHQFDTKAKNGVWGKVVTEIWGKLEFFFGVMNMEKLENYFYNRKIKGKQSATEIEDTQYIIKSLEYARAKNAHIIIIGHTHHEIMAPRLFVRQALTSINCGSCINGKWNYVIVDTEKDQVESGNFV